MNLSRFIALPWVLVLGACGYSESPSSALADYRAALAEVLKVDIASLEDYPPFALNYPARSERTAAVDPVQVNIRSFWSFKHCDLRAIIAMRNTALGRANSAVVKLPYEHDLLIALRQCLDSADEAEVSESVLLSLQSIYQRKRAMRAAAYWNNTFGSREFVALFSPSAAKFDSGVASIYVPVAEVVFLTEFANAFGKMSRDADATRIAVQFQALENSGYGGRLLKSLHEANFYLGEVNDLLGRRLQAGKVCAMTTPGKSAMALEHAFQRYHIRVIQPYLASLGRTAQPWISAIDELASGQRQVMPAGFESFYSSYLQADNPQGLWQQHLKTIRRHASLWSELFGQCGITLR